MKQRFILMILFIAFFTVSTVEAQNKALEKALKKEYKAKMKVYHLIYTID